jgi:hypothetical protein
LARQSAGRIVHPAVNDPDSAGEQEQENEFWELEHTLGLLASPEAGQETPPRRAHRGIVRNIREMRNTPTQG